MISVTRGELAGDEDAVVNEKYVRPILQTMKLMPIMSMTMISM